MKYEKVSNKQKFFAALVAVVGLSVCIMTYFSFETHSSKSGLSFVVAIDAGHGGIDGGVVGKTTNVKESDLNIAVAYLLKEEFNNCGIRVVMTRKDSNGLYGSSGNGFKLRDMRKRKEIILREKADLVVSVHMNSYPLASRGGPQVFFNEKSVSSKLLAQKVQTVLNDFSQKTYEALKGDYYMLNITQSPSVIVECGFLSNVEDEKQLCDPLHQAKVARKIFEGVMLFLSANGKDFSSVSI